MHYLPITEYSFTPPTYLTILYIKIIQPTSSITLVGTSSFFALPFCPEIGSAYGPTFRSHGKTSLLCPLLMVLTRTTRNVQANPRNVPGSVSTSSLAVHEGRVYLSRQSSTQSSVRQLATDVCLSDVGVSQDIVNKLISRFDHTIMRKYDRVNQPDDEEKWASFLSNEKRVRKDRWFIWMILNRATLDYSNLLTTSTITKTLS